MRNKKRINASATATACRRAFSRSGKTQCKLASQVGLHQGQISRFLKGDFVRLTPRLEQLCRLLGVTPVYAPQTLRFAPSREIVDALKFLLDGSNQRERDILRLLKAAKCISR